MKIRKRKFPVFPPRLTAFLLFLCMLLSVLTVFPSSVYAVGESSDQAPIAEEQTALPLEEDLSFQEPIDTNPETEFENLCENTVLPTTEAFPSSVHNTENTIIMLSGDTADIAQGSTRQLRVSTTLEISF